MVEIIELIKNDSNIKAIAINKDGEICFFSKGAMLAFGIPLDGEGLNIKEIFPSINFSSNSEHIHVVHGEKVKHYKIKVPQITTKEILISAEEIVLSEDYKNESDQADID